MKTVVAQRITSCDKCEETIDAGTVRLDDVIRLRNSKAGDQKYRRMHYHPQCYIDSLNEFIENPPPMKPAGGGGRPAALDLTEEQHSDRKRLLNRLRNHNNYWLSKLPLQKPFEELDLNDLQSFQSYVFRFSQISQQLELVGGLPGRYAALDLSHLRGVITTLESQLKVSVSSSLSNGDVSVIIE